MNRILLGFILFFVALSSFAKGKKVESIREKNFVDTIRISYRNSAILVPVKIGDRYYKFMFDTGATSFIINDSLRHIMQETGKKRECMDFNKVSQDLDRGVLPEVIMGKTHLTNVDVIAMSFNFPMGVDGVIGMRELNNSDIITKIDLKDSIIIITDRKDFFANENGQVMEYYPKLVCPKVKFSFSHGCKGGLMTFDTGCNSFMFLNDFYYKKSLKGKNKDLFMKQIEWTDTGSSSYSVHGIEKANEHVFMKMDEVKFGNLCINNIPVEIASGATVIGCRILEYGSMIMDSHAHTLTFQPYDKASTNINITQHNKGFHMYVKDDKIMVSLINPNGEEYKQGLRKDDVMIECNGIPITCKEDYLLRVRPQIDKLKSVMTKFKNKAGEIIDVEIKMD